MLVLGFQLAVGVSALNLLPESGYYIDIVLIVYQITKDTFLGYFEVYA
jgi:hypothetical protein